MLRKMQARVGGVRNGWRAAALVCALAIAAALSACGAAGQASHAQSTATTSTSSFPGSGMAVRPCPGPTGDATQAGASAVILTQQHASGSLHVGEVAQVRLPASLHWTLTSQPDHLSSIAAGNQDATLNVCYWTFHADSAGSVTLHFSGVPPCEGPPSNCSNAIMAQDITLTIA